MSLVAYGSSDESENEDEYGDQPQVQTKYPASTVPNESSSRNVQSPALKTEKVGDFNEETPTSAKTETLTVQDVNKSAKMNLPVPKMGQEHHSSRDKIECSDEEVSLNFNVLPKPKTIQVDDFKEADSALIPKKVDYGSIETPPKKKKGPTKISIPSLSDFKDLDEEDDDSKRRTIKPSSKQSGLIGILPAPKGSAISTKATTMLPHVLTRKTVESKPLISQHVNRTVIKKAVSQAIPSISTLTSLSGYNSDSEDDDDKGSSSDFFSLSTPAKISDQSLPSVHMIDIPDSPPSSKPGNLLEDDTKLQQSENDSTKILRNNVMDLPKEEIILKNKAEVGPKLPVPEQEYHLDSEGNVAFDEKAIEYLCGKRGVKRKNELSNVDIVEISGDDIKPDEREWLVKALTEEQVHRPMSVSSGPGGQSKKKHQITYLAHQAKAMELELKNQWAQNKANRQATRSKYGF